MEVEGEDYTLEENGYYLGRLVWLGMVVKCERCGRKGIRTQSRNQETRPLVVHKKVEGQVDGEGMVWFVDYCNAEGRVTDD
jgi:hypothetical protein